jgi:type IV secretory pathway VirB10-like protein
MLPPGTRFHAIIFLLATALYASATVAEIYQWVDADGNIHFGDKPQDAAQARAAKPVKVVEDYQPPVRTEEERAAIESERQRILQKNANRQRDQQQVEAETDSKRDQEKAARCAAYEADLKRLTTVETVNGIPTFYYVTGEDGKSVSSDRQREIVEELKTKMTAAGCP